MGWWFHKIHFSSYAPPILVSSNSVINIKWIHVGFLQVTINFPLFMLLSTNFRSNRSGHSERFYFVAELCLRLAFILFALSSFSFDFDFYLPLWQSVGSRCNYYPLLLFPYWKSTNRRNRNEMKYPFTTSFTTRTIFVIFFSFSCSSSAKSPSSSYSTTYFNAIILAKFDYVLFVR